MGSFFELKKLEGSTSVGASKKQGNITINFVDAFEQIEDDLQKSIVASTKTAFKEMVTGTPVDTGYARSSWSANIDGSTGPALAKLLTSKEAKLESTQTVKVISGGNVFEKAKTLGEVAYGNAQTTIDKGLQNINKLRDGDIQGVSITNNAPYIERLEKGWSSQNSYWIRAAALRLSETITQNMAR